MPHERLQIAIIGMGPFSRTVSEALHGMGHEVLAIDRDEAVVQEVHEAGIASEVVQANPEHLSALRELDLAAFDAVIVGRGTDLELSLLTVLNLLDLGVRQIYAKAIHARHAQLLERVGGDRLRVVYPERDMGLRLALQLTGQDIVEAVWADPEHAFAERPLLARLAGKSIAEAQLRANAGLVLVAIRRGERLLIAPPADTRFEPGDRLVLLGRNERLEHFA